jgi:prepilin-type N-terminal cleavage/methylation domain-containing protein
MKIKTQAGFTLIELLVVISIISFLASIMLVAVNKARTKSRDLKRVQDFKALQKAVEMYALANNEAYPSASSTISSYILGTIPGFDWSLLSQQLSNYIVSAPTPPSYSSAIGYFYVNNSFTSVGSQACPSPGPGLGYINVGPRGYYFLTGLEEPNSSLATAFDSTGKPMYWVYGGDVSFYSNISNCLNP